MNVWRLPRRIYSRGLLILLCFFCMLSVVHGSSLPVDYIQLSKNYKSDKSKFLANLRNLENIPLNPSGFPTLVVYYIVLGENENCIQTNSVEQSKTSFQKALDYAAKTNSEAIELWANSKIAYCYYRSRKLSEASNYLITCRQLLKEVPEEAIIDPIGTYRRIGFFTSTIGSTNEALGYLKKALSYSYDRPEDQADLLDNIALIYLTLKDTAEAEVVLDRAGALSKKINHEIRYAKVLGNKAEILKNRGNINQAVALLKEDIAISKRLKEDQNRLFASMKLAHIYADNDSIKQAQIILEEISNLIAKKENLAAFSQEYVRLQLQIASKTRDTNSELHYRRVLDSLDILAQKWDGHNVVDAASWLIRQQDLLDKKEKNKESVKSKSVWAATAVVSFFIICLSIWFFFLNKRKKKNQMASQMSLVSARTVNGEESITIRDGLAEDAAKLNTLNRARLMELLDSHLRTEEGWNEFKQFFKGEYKEFYETIENEFPEINDSNLRYIALLKMNIGKHKICEALGVGPDAIKKTKQRLRQKMGHEKFAKLENIISN